MDIKEYLNGIQHVGIPTNDIEKTVDFYKSIGFEENLVTVNEETNQKVVFLSCGNLIVETYENKEACMKVGAIDHISIDVKDIEKVFDIISKGNYEMVTDKIQFLPFWEKGVKFFIILGPNKEKVEFAQKL
ncbi:MAG: VOC family protein [Eubacteriales bacterium]